MTLLSSFYYDTEPSQEVLQSIVGGAVVGACVSQMLYGGVRPLTVVLGILGGIVWHKTEASSSLAGKFYSSEK